MGGVKGTAGDGVAIWRDATVKTGREVNWLIDGLQLCATLIWPDASNAQNSIPAVSQGSTVCATCDASAKRPSGRRADGQRDELVPYHSITSSARASSVGGTSRPSALAVPRLITSSYLVGAWTGSSAGSAPFRMRST